MGIFSPVQLFVESLSALTIKAERRLKKLEEGIAAVDANTSATVTERLLANSIGLWLAGLDFWLSMAPQKTLPLLIIGVQASTSAQTGSNEVNIFPPSGTTAPQVTPIRQIGGTATLAVPAPPVLSTDRRKLTLDVSIPANPTHGTYEGVIYQDQTALAGVIVFIT